MPNPVYNINPSPQPGNGAYGSVPGSVAAPPSIFDQLGSNLPNFGSLTSGGSGDILSMLSGTLSPQTQNNIGNYAAARGVALGQPNSNISNEIGMNVTGNTSQQIQQQGLGDLNSFLNTTGSEQQNPALISSIASENAINAAAPNPTAAAQQLLATYQSMNPGGGSKFSFNPGSGVTAPSGSGVGGYLNSLMSSLGLGGGGGNPYSTYSTGGSGMDNVAFA